MLVMAIGMFLGYKMHHSMSPSQSQTTNESGLGEIMSLVNEKYVDTIATDSIQSMAIDKVLAQLDPHSVYIPPRDLKAVDDDLGGSFEGVGVEFYLLKDTIIVTSVINGGPSDDAGLISGDKIIKIDDSIVSGKKIGDEGVIKKLRGRKGTKVLLTILRGSKVIKDINITRGTIPLYSIDAAYMIENTTAYIKINRFGEKTYEEFIERLQKLGLSNIKNLIIDLRDNPGGYLEAACAIADEIIADKKMLVYTKGRNGQRDLYKSKNPGLFEKIKIAVLIDEGSASAAEILSGAIQDHDRGTVIGRRSFGKGLVQEQYPLSNGGALRLTVARYYLPSGRCVQKDYSHGLSAYESDVLNRYNSGELTAKDSIKFKDSTSYRTMSGRVVYGGGGIVPDVFIPLDTAKYSRSLGDLLATGYINDLTNDFITANREELKKYKLAIDIETKLDINSLLKNIKNKCVENKVSISSFTHKADSEYLSRRIKAQIARSVIDQNAQYQIINEEDPFIIEALKGLK
jgi:carboxyl-terminal processing protease